MFKLDSPLMNFLNKVADIMILNILFIVFSIPIVTMGASFTAAYYMGFKMVKNEESYITKGFWKAFKENFKQSTIIWIIVLLIVAILFADYRIVLYSGISFGKWLAIAMVTVTVVVLMGVVYVFPLQARFTNTIKNTIKNAFLMSISHLPTTIVLIAVYAIPVIILYFIPQSLPVLVLLACGFIIYLKSIFLLKVFKKYETYLVDKVDELAQSEESEGGLFAESEKMENEN